MNRKHVVYTSEPLAKEDEEKKGEKQTDQDNLSKGDNTSVEKQNKKTADELTKEDIVNLLGKKTRFFLPMIKLTKTNVSSKMTVINLR